MMLTGSFSLEAKASMISISYLLCCCVTDLFIYPHLHKPHTAVFFRPPVLKPIYLFIYQVD